MRQPLRYACFVHWQVWAAGLPASSGQVAAPAAAAVDEAALLEVGADAAGHNFNNLLSL